MTEYFMRNGRTREEDWTIVAPLRASWGTLRVLYGEGRDGAEDRPTCAYLLLGEECPGKCGFCPLSAPARRQRPSSRTFLARVTWSEAEPHRMVRASVEAVGAGWLKRICVQVTRERRAFRGCLALLSALKARASEAGLTEVSISACLPASSVDEVGEVVWAGAERVGIPLDAASEEVYEKVKGTGWRRRWRTLERASQAFPGRITTHLIAGLGESERDILQCLGRARELGVTVGMFSFTPVRSTPMEGRPYPDVASYRMIQLAAFLIGRGLSAPDEFRFDAMGRIRRFPMDEGEIRGLVLSTSGLPFVTSGCPGCNRPYYNESPRGPFYNYPRLLRPEEAKRELELVLWALRERDST